MSLIFLMMMRYSHSIYHQEIQQKFHIGTAARFAVLAGWTPLGWADANAVAGSFARLVTANKQFHVFILDQHGLVLSHYPSSLTLTANRISLEPIKIILQPKPRLPVLGDDPATFHGRQIFSAVQLLGASRPEKYLYVTLHGEEDEETGDDLRLAYVTREGAWLFFACLMLALAGGLLSLNFIVRPVKQLASMMDVFRENHFKGDFADSEKAFVTGDEIDILTATFYRMAEQMQAQMQEIEQADSIRRELIANVSHDLRTPLASIQGYLDTLSLKNDALSSQDRQQYLQIALNQAKSLNQLIDTLFYLAKLDSGQIEPQPERFRIDEVVQDVVQKFALHAQKKNIRLATAAHGRLPFVRADVGLIERALSNLIDNALRHTPEGGSVELSLQHINKKVWVSVTDSGSGISDADLPRIFERFYRGNSAREGAALNAGIGLSIVHRIVAMHGETVEASNAPARGAQFRFSLSVVDSAGTPREPEQISA